MRIQAVIFDWAGTVVDYGCRAPVVVLEEIFAARGVRLHSGESRHGMGLMKRDHIRAILRLPRVSAAWREAAGQMADEAAVEELYARFLPRQMEVIEEYSDVIRGVPELMERLRSAGVRVGSTTGYTRPMIERVLPKAARQGFAPDCVVTPDDVGQGRPYPWMMFENMRRLGVFPPGACLKCGDTVVDMEEGRNAGAVTVGVAASSSEAAVHGAAEARSLLEQAGAGRVVDLAGEIWEILEEL